MTKRKSDFTLSTTSLDELFSLQEERDDAKLEIPVLVAAFYGLRRGEVLGLKWDTIDFERHAPSRSGRFLEWV